MSAEDFPTVAIKGVKVPMKLYKVNGRTVASIDRVNEIRGMHNAGFQSTRLESGLFVRSVAPGIAIGTYNMFTGTETPAAGRL
ncbi:hypothetical protein [Streptomyces megasporus]|uniref:hypothetical protein n=1 Tax=Streptomyces megasporus TaxID=44060 RepID=UPI0004E115FB|nr:hypothetical protein [Streptomyces megasporus]